MIENKEAIKCKYCTCKKREKCFGSDRQCGFKEDGTFTSSNWECPLLVDTFTAVNDEIWLGNDSYAVIRSVYDEETHESYALLMTRYKHRGTILSVQKLACDGPVPTNINEVYAAYKQKYEQNDD